MDIKDFILLGHHDKIPILKKNLTSIKNFKALDLGCENPFALSILFHDFGVKLIKGIELLQHEKALQEHFKGNHDKSYFEQMLANSSSFYDIYCKYVEVNDKCLIKYRLSEKEFQSQILGKIEFGTDLRDFLEANQTKYDLIIASNILHYLNNINELKKIIIKIKNSLNENGFVYFRIQTVSLNTSISYSNYLKIIDETFENYTIIESENKEKKGINSYFYNLSSSEIKN